MGSETFYGEGLDETSGTFSWRDIKKHKQFWQTAKFVS